MNCETIDSFLDDHLVARLTPAERQRAAEHVGACGRCSAAWAADNALRTETVAGPPPELFGALLRRVAVAPVRREAAGRNRGLWLVGAAAALVVVAIAARFTAVMPGLVNAHTHAAMTLFRGLADDSPEATPPSGVSSAASTTVDASRFVAGRDYELRGATTTVDSVVDGKVEVTEFFMFECFPCYAFEPGLLEWEARNASQVALTRVPAMFRPDAELHARAYYTAEALGRLDAVHAAMFDEIHVRGNRLGTRAALAEFFGGFGIDAATFDAAFDSREVDARVQRAVALNREYRVVATPTLVVAGRYSTNPSLAQSEMLAVVDQLVADAFKNNR